MYFSQNPRERQSRKKTRRLSRLYTIRSRYGCSGGHSINGTFKLLNLGITGFFGEILVNSELICSFHLPSFKLFCLITISLKTIYATFCFSNSSPKSPMSMSSSKIRSLGCATVRFSTSIYKPVALSSCTSFWVTCMGCCSVSTKIIVKLIMDSVTHFYHF